MNIIDLIKDNQSYITIGIGSSCIILLIFSLILFKKVSTMKGKYENFMRGASGNNIEELVIKYFDKIDEVKKETSEAINKTMELEQRMTSCLQKISILRYKAFENVGSDLSFSIAMLDDNNDGIILTGIYGRNESTTYAKPIDKGMSRYDLSEEEKEVLYKAMNSK